MIRSWPFLSLIATTMSISLFSQVEQYYDDSQEDDFNTEVVFEQEADSFFELSDATMDSPSSPQWKKENMNDEGNTKKSPYPSQDAHGEMFASAQAQLGWEGWKVELTGEWLYWKAREE